jgi:hypothetical protein
MRRRPLMLALALSSAQFGCGLLDTGPAPVSGPAAVAGSADGGRSDGDALPDSADEVVQSGLWTDRSAGAVLTMKGGMMGTYRAQAWTRAELTSAQLTALAGLDVVRAKDACYMADGFILTLAILESDGTFASYRAFPPPPDETAQNCYGPTVLSYPTLQAFTDSLPQANCLESRRRPQGSSVGSDDGCVHAFELAGGAAAPFRDSFVLRIEQPGERVLEVLPAAVEAKLAIIEPSGATALETSSLPADGCASVRYDFAVPGDYPVNLVAGSPAKVLLQITSAAAATAPGRSPCWWATLAAF